LIKRKVGIVEDLFGNILAPTEVANGGDG